MAIVDKRDYVIFNKFKYFWHEYPPYQTNITNLSTLDWEKKFHWKIFKLHDDFKLKQLEDAIQKVKDGEISAYKIELETI